MPARLSGGLTALKRRISRPLCGLLMPRTKSTLQFGPHSQQYFKFEISNFKDKGLASSDKRKCLRGAWVIQAQ
jgi:hypothetical protein